MVNPGQGEACSQPETHRLESRFGLGQPGQVSRCSCRKRTLPVASQPRAMLGIGHPEKRQTGGTRRSARSKAGGTAGAAAIWSRMPRPGGVRRTGQAARDRRPSGLEEPDRREERAGPALQTNRRAPAGKPSGPIPRDRSLAPSGERADRGTGHGAFARSRWITVARRWAVADGGWSCLVGAEAASAIIRNAETTGQRRSIPSGSTPAIRQMIRSHRRQTT